MEEKLQRINEFTQNKVQVNVRGEEVFKGLEGKEKGYLLMLLGYKKRYANKEGCFYHLMPHAMPKVSEESSLASLAKEETAA